MHNMQNLEMAQGHDHVCRELATCTLVQSSVDGGIPEVPPEPLENQDRNVLAPDRI